MIKLIKLGLHWVILNKWLIRLTKDGRRVVHSRYKLRFAQEFEQATRQIQVELANILNNEIVPAFEDVSPMQRYITSDKRWGTFWLKGYDEDATKNQKLCPFTTALIKKFPEISSCMFSILAPGKQIPPHFGPYNGVLRFHLPLIVPSVARCALGIKRNKKSIIQFLVWEIGRSITFDDSFEHSVRNDSDEIRVVLFIDVKRDLPWWLKGINNKAYKVVKRLFMMDSGAFVRDQQSDTTKH